MDGFFSLQLPVLVPQALFALDVLRVDRDAGHRTDLHALRLVKMPDAFGAFVRVDLVDLRAHVDGIVRALGLAHVAIDAFVGDQQCHLIAPFEDARSAKQLPPAH